MIDTPCLREIPKFAPEQLVTGQAHPGFFVVVRIRNDFPMTTTAITGDVLHLFGFP